MSKPDDNPYYTPAKPIPGQMEIPIGTVHTCAQCKSDYICDLADCRIDRVTFGIESPCCGNATRPHSQNRANVECKHCGDYGCEVRHKVCAVCKGLDGRHWNCSTQPGYQFGLLIGKEVTP
jgi:hypothetical protein